MIWSYRYGIGSPKDTGSMLHIAEIDENKPWQLISEPHLLSRPLFGWENNSGTINNEGPYPLVIGDKIYLAYSGGVAGGESYAVGYLCADSGADLLNADNWERNPRRCFIFSRLTESSVRVTIRFSGMSGENYGGASCARVGEVLPVQCVPPCTCVEGGVSNAECGRRAGFAGEYASCGDDVPDVKGNIVKNPSAFPSRESGRSTEELPLPKYSKILPFRRPPMQECVISGHDNYRIYKKITL